MKIITDCNGINEVRNCVATYPLPIKNEDGKFSTILALDIEANVKMFYIHAHKPWCLSLKRRSQASRGEFVFKVTGEYLFWALGQEARATLSDTLSYKTQKNGQPRKY